MLPVTRHFGSGSIGLDPSFKDRAKKSLSDAYSSRGSATSSKSGMKILITHSFLSLKSVIFTIGPGILAVL